MGSRLARIRDWHLIAREAKFRPSDIAALCPISQRQLVRFFKLTFGKTVEEWCREERCRLAVDLIQQGYSSGAAADQAGFSSTAHLCHEFQRRFGRAPQTFSRTYSDSRMSLKDKNVLKKQQVWHPRN